MCSIRNFTCVLANVLITLIVRDKTTIILLAFGLLLVFLRGCIFYNEK